MIKIFLILIAVLIVVSEFWFLTKLKQEPNIKSQLIKISKMSPIVDKNNSVSSFFDPIIWQRTQADQEKKPKPVDINKTKITNFENNDTIQLVTTKGTRALCRGKKCITIKAIMSNTLLLEDEKKIISLKPLDFIFGNIKLIAISDTKLFFENNNTKQRYDLRFFSYIQKKDTNDTNNTNQHEDKIK